MRSIEAKRTTNGAWLLLPFAGLLGAALSYGTPVRTSSSPRHASSNGEGEARRTAVEERHDALAVERSDMVHDLPTHASRSPDPARVSGVASSASPSVLTEEGAAGSGASLESMGGARQAPSLTRFEAEGVVAPSWREQRIAGAFEQADIGAALLSAECRTTLCRLEVDMTLVPRDARSMQPLVTLLSRSSPSVAFGNQKATILLDADKLDG